MKITRLIQVGAGMFLLLLTGALILSWRLGAWKSVRLYWGAVSAQHQIYLEHRGPYHQIVPVIEKVEAWAKAKGLNCETSFGEYLDNPREVDEDRLRSRGGCIIVTNTVGSHSPSFLSEDDKKAGFQERWTPEQEQALIAEFDGAPSISPFKVYPKAFKEIEQQGKKLVSGTTEIYKTQGQAVHTTYIFPAQ